MFNLNLRNLDRGSDCELTFRSLLSSNRQDVGVRKGCHSLSQASKQYERWLCKISQFAIEDNSLQKGLTGNVI